MSQYYCRFVITNLGEKSPLYLDVKRLKIFVKNG